MEHVILLRDKMFENVESIGILINYHLDDQTTLVEVQMYGPISKAAAKYSVPRDHIVQPQLRKYLAIVGIHFLVPSNSGLSLIVLDAMLYQTNDAANNHFLV